MYENKIFKRVICNEVTRETQATAGIFFDFLKKNYNLKEYEEKK